MHARAFVLVVKKPVQSRILGAKMGRPITLITGQWADLSSKELAPFAKKIGSNDLELACGGDPLEVGRALGGDGSREKEAV